MTEVIGLVPTTRSDMAVRRVDVALLASALFLQRFSLPFGNTGLQLDLVAAAFILLQQFLSGKLVVHYDRLFWFLGIGLVATCSLLLNFNTTMLTAYFLFLLLCFLFTLSRPSTPDRYRSMLQAFQFLVIVLSCLAVAQFLAQFVMDARKLIMFYGIIPVAIKDSGTFAILNHVPGSSLVRSNGIFLAEASNFSQLAALGILTEILEFRRPRYLFVMVLGFLLSYSGTGFMILALFLPFAGLRHGRVALSVVFVVMFALALFVTGMIDPSVFVSRTNEFESIGSSGFQRFTAPLWNTAKFFDTGSLQALLVGNGPGTAKTFGDAFYGGFGMPGWCRPVYEYGLIGAFIFVCFSASCLKRSRYPGLLLAALIFYVLVVSSIFTSWVATITIVLCTLHGPESRRAPIGPAGKPLRGPLPTPAAS